MESALSQLKRGGTLVLVGAGIRRPKFDNNRILLNELTITGSFVYDADGFERALELLADDEILAGRVRAGLAESHRLQGDLDTAQRLALESAEMAARVGDDEFHAFALVHVGCYAIARSDLVTARQVLATTLEIGERIGDPWTSAVGLLFVADVARIDGDDERAARLIGASRTAYDEIGPGRWEADREHWEPLLAALDSRLGADRLDELQHEGADLGLAAAVALGRAVVES
jgi:hypothetical protein